MNSLEILKKLKSISPERMYTERSKTQILTTDRPRHLSPWRMLVESLEVGSAMVLAGAFLILILGGFSGLKMFNVASLNPTSLKAEAEAIDMQIKLSSLNYQDFARAIAAKQETTPAAATSIALMSAEQATSSASSTPVGIDDALKALSQ